MKILFVCTHNRCRSILSEAIARDLAASVIEARSAGSEPSGVVHPQTLQALARRGYNTDGLLSQSWHDFKDWQPDVVMTVCDSAAGEQCPLYLTEAIRCHWPLVDPSKIAGNQLQIDTAFDTCIDTIVKRIRSLSTIAQQPMSSWSRLIDAESL
jgi:arsenate reductase